MKTSAECDTFTVRVETAEISAYPISQFCQVQQDKARNYLQLACRIDAGLTSIPTPLSTHKPQALRFTMLLGSTKPEFLSY